MNDTETTVEWFGPTALNAPPPCEKGWWDAVCEAWLCSREGRVEQARALYEYADSFLDEYELNASLSVLRHNGGTGSGTVRPVPPTEDLVVSLLLPRLRTPSLDANRLIDEIPEATFEQLMGAVTNRHKSARPHIMVMSTGRCGTMSLYRLFRGSNLEA